MKNFRGEPMLWRVLLLFLSCGVLVHRATAQQVLVVANPSVKAAEVSSGELRDVFTGASSSFKEGSRVAPVLLKAGPVNDAFLNQYVGKSDTAFRATWRSLLFSGEGVMPRTFDSEAALVEYVARTPGAIGYVGKSSPHEGVKVLTVR